jgi:hypothetical protein
MAVTMAALVEVHASRLDVIEMGDDDEPVGQGAAGVFQLPRDGQGRVLVVLV